MIRTKSNGAGARNNGGRKLTIEQRRKDRRLKFIERHIIPFRRFYKNLTLTPHDVYTMLYKDR